MHGYQEQLQWQGVYGARLYIAGVALLGRRRGIESGVKGIWDSFSHLQIVEKFDDL